MHTTHINTQANILLANYYNKLLEQQEKTFLKPAAEALKPILSTQNLTNVSYNVKLVVAGDTVEVYEYEKPIQSFISPKKRSTYGKAKESTDEERAEYKKKNDNKKVVHLKRLCRTNFFEARGGDETVKFLTLTYKDNKQDLDAANADFTNFIKRLNYKAFGTKKAVLDYVAIHEKQARGAIHYHVILFNMPYIPARDIEYIWSHGFIKISMITTTNKLERYVTKYITKNIKDAERNKRAFFRSKGLKKYFTLRAIQKVSSEVKELLIAAFNAGELLFTHTFENTWHSLAYTKILLPLTFATMFNETAKKILSLCLCLNNI